MFLWKIISVTQYVFLTDFLIGCECCAFAERLRPHALLIGCDFGLICECSVLAERLRPHILLIGCDFGLICECSVLAERLRPHALLIGCDFGLICECSVLTERLRPHALLIGCDFWLTLKHLVWQRCCHWNIKASQYCCLTCVMGRTMAVCNMSVLTDWRLQWMSSFGAPAGRMNIWAICIDPVIIFICPAIKMNLKKSNTGHSDRFTTLLQCKENK